MLTFIKNLNNRVEYLFGNEIYIYSTHNNKGIKRTEGKWFKLHEKGTLIAIKLEQRRLLTLLYYQYHHNKLNQMYLLINSLMIKDVTDYILKMIL